MFKKGSRTQKRKLSIDLDRTGGSKIPFYSHREVAVACHAVEGQSHD